VITLTSYTYTDVMGGQFSSDVTHRLPSKKIVAVECLVRSQGSQRANCGAEQGDETVFSSTTIMTPVLCTHVHPSKSTQCNLLTF
jgi:hypothetical protein